MGLPTLARPIIIGELVALQYKNMSFVDADVLQGTNARHEQFSAEALLPEFWTNDKVLQIATPAIMPAHDTADEF